MHRQYTDNAQTILSKYYSDLSCSLIPKYNGSLKFRSKTGRH
jgi:hypothetical protein